ncbi:hypothetical protein [Limosilactobacillus vaginalis]|uniref:hypothetical protein n=1 Tax=Limosilactobacillus vaginalis TaxID=1633 RepID=UPI0022E66CF3|nr:hypothetical protein [Limosilactobacillus vaginalis]
MTYKDYECRKFNGWYAVVDSCDNVFFESKDKEKALNYFMDHIDENDDLYLTKEMELYCDGMIELGFTGYQPISIEY